MGFGYSTYGIAVSPGLADLKTRMGFLAVPPHVIDQEEKIEILTEKINFNPSANIYSFEYDKDYEHLKLTVFFKIKENLVSIKKIYRNYKVDFKNIGE